MYRDNYHIHKQLCKLRAEGKPYIFINTNHLPEVLDDYYNERMALQKSAKTGVLIIVDIAYKDIGAIDKVNSTICLENVEVYEPNKWKPKLHYLGSIDHTWVDLTWIEDAIKEDKNKHTSLLLPAMAYEYVSGTYTKYGVKNPTYGTESSDYYRKWKQVY